MNIYQKWKIIPAFLVIAYLSMAVVSAASFTDLDQVVKDTADYGIIILSENYTYDTTTDTNINNGITIDKNVTIDGQGCVIDANSQMRIFNIASGVEVVLENITFINGKDATWGGAIMCTGGLTVKNCRFINNTASAGGALFTTAQHVDVKDSVFKNNSASGAGGAMVTGDNTIITGSLFQNNTAPAGSIHILSHASDTKNFLNYNIILDGGTVIYNNGTGTVNADFNWWGNNNDPASKATGEFIEVDKYYTMRLASIDSPKYEEEYEFDYIFELNDNGDHTGSQLPKFTVDIKYNEELVDTIDGRYNETLATTIDSIGNNEIEIYSFDTSITSRTFGVKGNAVLNIEFSKEAGTVGEQIEITIEALDQYSDSMDVDVKLYANDTYLNTVSVENGVGSYTYTPTNIGTATIKAKFEGNKDYNAEEVEEELAVKGSVDLKIGFLKDAGIVGEQIEITIEAIDQDGSSMDVDVKLYANGV
jgi:hypothetical protein